MSAARLNRLVLLGVAALAAATYASTLRFALVWDDTLLIERNQALGSLGTLWDAWWQPFWAGTAEVKNMGGAVYYRPLVHSLLFVVHAAVGSSALPFHALVVGGHALATALVAALAMRQSGRVEAGLVAGALFAVHPIHTEAVAWVSGISDVYMTVFVLLAVWVAGNQRALSAIRALAVTLLVLAAGLTKEPGVLAGVFVLISAVSVRRVAAVAVAWAGYLVMRTIALQGIDAPVTHASLGITGWLFAGLSLFGQAVTSLVAPVQLNAFHVLEPASAAQVMCGVLMLLLMAALAFKATSALRVPMAMLLLGLLPGTIVPRLGLNAFAERYLYLPSAGFTLVLGFAAVVVMTQWPKLRAPLLAAVSLVIALGAASSIARNRVWASNLALFTDIEKQSPSWPMLTENLSQAYVESGRPVDAIALLSRRAHLSVGEELNLGIAQAATRQLSAANETFQRALAHASGTTEGLLLTNLCMVQQNQGQLEHALISCQRAVGKVPFIAQTAAVNSRALMMSGRLDEAKAEAERAYQLDPSNGPAKSMRQRLRHSFNAPAASP